MESITTHPAASGDAVQVRTYSADVSTHASDSLSITQVRVTDIDTYADRYLNLFTAQFRNAGATNPVVLNRHELSVDHHPAVTFQFKFTAKNGQQPTWLITLIATPGGLLTVQCFDSSTEASSSRIRTDQSRILASVRIP
jgi:hypothetical protein